MLLLCLSLQGKHYTRANKTHLNWVKQLVHEECNIFGLKTVSPYIWLSWNSLCHNYVFEASNRDNCNEIQRQAGQ